MVNIMNCCRLCLKDDEVLNKFDCKDITELCVKINQHFDVLISEADEYSTKICHECANKVYQFALFYNAVQHNQQELNWCMMVQKKVNEVKQEDDECIIIEVETDDLSFIPIAPSNMKTENITKTNNDSVNTNNTDSSNRKRSSDDAVALTVNNSKKLCTVDNIHSAINEIIADVKQTATINKFATTITNNSNAAEENNKEFTISDDESKSLSDLKKQLSQTQIKQKGLNKLKQHKTLNNLSNDNAKLFKRYKCKNSLVRLPRLTILENLLSNRKKVCEIKTSVHLNRSAKTSKDNTKRDSINSIRSESSKVSEQEHKNNKNVSVQKLKGKVSKQLNENIDDTKSQNNMNKNNNEKQIVTKMENTNILKSIRSLEENTESTGKKIKKLKFSKKKELEKVQNNNSKSTDTKKETSSNRKLIELNDSKTYLKLNKTKSKMETINHPIDKRKGNTVQNIVNSQKQVQFIQVQKTNSTEQPETQQQHTNVAQIPVIITAGNSKLVTSSPQNIQNCTKSAESLSIVINPNQFESMMKQTEKPVSDKLNINNSTKTITSNNPQNVPNLQTQPLLLNKLNEPKINILHLNKNTTIRSSPYLPQNTSTISTTSAINTKTHITNTKKAPVELYTRHLYPGKLPKGQSLTESFCWQNRIPNSIASSSRLEEQKEIATNSTVSVQTMQSAIPATITGHNPTFYKIIPIHQSQLAIQNKVVDTSVILPPVTGANRSGTTVNKNIIITKNLHTINNLLQKQQQNNQPQLQNNLQQIEQTNQPPTNFQQSFQTVQPSSNFELTEIQQKLLRVQKEHDKNRKLQPAIQQQQFHLMNKNEMQHQQNQQQIQPQNNKPINHQQLELPNNNTKLKFKILTVPELNQKAANNQLLYNKSWNSSTSCSATTSFIEIPSHHSIQPQPNNEPIFKNKLSRTKIVATLPKVDNSSRPRISVKILVHSENKNQLTIKLNNLATGKLCHYWDLSDSQKEAVKQSLIAIDKKSVEKFKPYQLDEYAKNLLERINFIEFRNNFSRIGN